MSSTTPSAANLLELLAAQARSFVDGARSSRSPPLELRAKLVELQRELQPMLERVPKDDVLLELLERRVLTFVDAEVRAYLAWQKPSLRIFQNALRSTAKHAQTKVGISTVRCTACGAARENEAVHRCQYCGTPLLGATT